MIGQVKTRLARTVGDEKALKIYTELLRHTRTVCEDYPCHRYLFYSDFIDFNDDWSEMLFQKRMQYSGDLGVRMANALSDILLAYDQAVLIGSDCATLNVGHLEDAFDILSRQEVVIGPASDGGYYLIGMKRIQLDLFINMPWSTPDVLPQTITRLNAMGLSYGLTEQLSDIDEWKDWEQWGWDV